MRLRYLFFALTAILLAGAAFFFISIQVQADPAPDWKLQDLDGKTVKLSDFKGKILVLNFWATWCPPCVEEIPDFIAVAKEYQGEDVAFVGASIDSIQPGEVADFAKKIGINYPIVMATQEMADKYDPEGGVPMTFIIDRKGNIALRHLAIFPKSDLEAAINQLHPRAVPGNP